jgi:hypothetical protein
VTIATDLASAQSSLASVETIIASWQSQYTVAAGGKAFYDLGGGQACGTLLARLNNSVATLQSMIHG